MSPLRRVAAAFLVAAMLFPSPVFANHSSTMIRIQAVKGVISGIHRTKGRITVKGSAKSKIKKYIYVSRADLVNLKVGDYVAVLAERKPKMRYSYTSLSLVKLEHEKLAPAPQGPTDQVVSPPASSSHCIPLPPATGKTVTVGTVKELKNALEDANATGGNVTILLRDGTYEFEGFMRAARKTASHITIRSLSGDRDKVILKGQGFGGYTSHIFWVSGDYTTIADLTVGWVANHPIQVFGENDPDNLLIHNVRFVDGGEQLLKVSFAEDRRDSKPENGIVECSLFEYSAGIGPQWYIGGIDVHNAVNWIIRDNVFRGIRSPTSDWAEHAIHFWNGSQGSVVERNIIINSDRGIGFGLGKDGHTGGTIRNNLLYHNESRGDVGIGLESAPGAKVYDNRIFHKHDYPNAIEYRFARTTGVEIKNNTTNKRIQKRDNGEAVLENNVTDAPLPEDLMQKLERGQFSQAEFF